MTQAPSLPIRLLVLAALAAVVAFAFVARAYLVDQMTLVVIYAIAILGLNMVTGYAGAITLGHGAFFAVGAYTQAILMQRYGCSPYVAILFSCALSAAAGLAFGFPALRLRGLYLALGTLAISMSLPPLLNRFDGLTGGHSGMVVDTLSAPAGLPLTGSQWTFLLVLAIAVVMFLVARRLLDGALGRALISIRDNELAAQVMGVNATHYLTLTFAMSSLYAGTAGALYTVAVGFVSPDSFSLMLSIGFFVSGVVGGLTSVTGAIFGGLFLQYVPVWASDIDKALGGFIYGAILIAGMLLLPEGLVSLPRRIARGWRFRQPGRRPIQPTVSPSA